MGFGDLLGQTRGSTSRREGELKQEPGSWLLGCGSNPVLGTVAASYFDDSRSRASQGVSSSGTEVKRIEKPARRGSDPTTLA